MKRSLIEIVQRFYIAPGAKRSFRINRVTVPRGGEEPFVSFIGWHNILPLCRYGMHYLANALRNGKYLVICDDNVGTYLLCAFAQGAYLRISQFHTNFL